MAVALAPNEKSACASATASVADKTLGVDANPVYTIPGSVDEDTQCVTVTADTNTVTEPGPTTTEVQTTTVPGPTTTITQTVTVTQPPTTTSSNSPPQELIFPRNAHPLGDAPDRACGDPSPPADCHELDDFTQTDYEGWSTRGTNERMEWVVDPNGSGKVVMRFQVVANDSADQFGGTRVSMFRNNVNCSGCEGWVAWGFYVPASSPDPDGWALGWQSFYPGGGSPPIAMEFQNAGCGSAAPRNHVCWINRNAAGTVIKHDLGPVQKGHWHYIVENVLYSSGAGFDKVWLGVDALPDVGVAPGSIYNGQTLYGSSAGRLNPMIYRANTSSGQTLTVMFCGVHQAATAATAMSLPNCPLGSS